ncbi:AP-3 complex subunit sigma-2 [Caerostris extrusa]|uniref:AP-3 complex subunit sigma-2 n=1 Tax=Caerostris extrusa TaxID=172846 RepID=A0AAV4W589_CAEEX|nr:AP-3 complex subunit sigma-2 [Caerostris extrusa]
MIMYAISLKVEGEYFSLIGGSDFKLIYRHYATLYFVFCVDSSESELGILDLIQVFVETLDKCFEMSVS